MVQAYDYYGSATDKEEVEPASLGVAFPGKDSIQLCCGSAD